MTITKEILQSTGEERKPVNGAGADGVQNFFAIGKMASWRLIDTLDY